MSSGDRARKHDVIERIEEKLGSSPGFELISELDFASYIATSSLVQDYLHNALEHMASSATYQLPGYNASQAARVWQIFRDPRLTINLSIIDTDTAAETDGSPAAYPVQPCSRDVYLYPLAVDGGAVTRYRLKSGDAPFPVLEFTGREEIREGVPLVFEKEKDVAVYDLTGITIFLEIAGRATSAVLPKFLSSDMSFAGWISTDVTASRIELLTRTLAEFSYTEALDVLLPLTDHPEYYVRWNTTRHILRLDREIGRQCVLKALDDPHPSVREIAKVTMVKLFS